MLEALSAARQGQARLSAAVTGPVMEDLRELYEAAVNRSKELEAESADLSSTVARLEEVDRLKDEFLAMVNHKLRTPITVVLGMAQTLVGRPDMAATADGQEILQRVVRQGKRLRDSSTPPRPAGSAGSASACSWSTGWSGAWAAGSGWRTTPAAGPGSWSSCPTWPRSRGQGREPPGRRRRPKAMDASKRLPPCWPAAAGRAAAGRLRRPRPRGGGPVQGGPTTVPTTPPTRATRPAGQVTLTGTSGPGSSPAACSWTPTAGAPTCWSAASGPSCGRAPGWP